MPFPTVKHITRYIRKDILLWLIAIVVVVASLSPLSTSAFHQVHNWTASYEASEKPPFCGIDAAELEIGMSCGNAVYLGSFKGRRLYTLPAQPVVATWHNGFKEGPISIKTDKFSGFANTRNLAFSEDHNAPYRAARICAMHGADWYLPSWQELEFIYQAAAHKGLNFLPAAKYWSSSVHKFNAKLVYYVDFSEGLMARSNPPRLSYYVKCVRTD